MNDAILGKGAHSENIVVGILFPISEKKFNGIKCDYFANNENANRFPTTGYTTAQPNFVF